MKEKAVGMFSGAVAGLILGGLWSIWFPLNKRLWTSSYVLFAAGWTLLILSICYFAIEIKKYDGAWTYPWRVFGANAIFAYALAELLSIVVDIIPVGSNGHMIGLKGFIYAKVFVPIGNPPLSSLLYSLSYLLVCFVPCLLLFRRRIFIKI
jgi:predicted acyltransferase